MIYDNLDLRVAANFVCSISKTRPEFKKMVEFA